jgi:hypothetical protein
MVTVISAGRRFPAARRPVRAGAVPRRGARFRAGAGQCPVLRGDELEPVAAAAGRVVDQQVRAAARDGVVGEGARPGLGLRGARRRQQFPGTGEGHAQGAGEVGQDRPRASPGPRLGVFLRGARSRGDRVQHRGSPPSGWCGCGAVPRGCAGRGGPRTASLRMSRVSAAVSTTAGISARPVTAALYRRWQPSLWPGFEHCPLSDSLSGGEAHTV